MARIWLSSVLHVLLRVGVGIAAIPDLLQAQRDGSVVLRWSDSGRSPVEYRFEEEQVASMAVGRVVSVRLGRAARAQTPCLVTSAGRCDPQSIRVYAESLGVGITSQAAVKAIGRVPASQSDLLRTFVPLVLPDFPVVAGDSWPVRYRDDATGTFGRGSVVYVGSARLDSISVRDPRVAFISIRGQVQAKVSGGGGSDGDSALEGTVIWDIDSGRLESGRVSLRGVVRGRDGGNVIAVSRERLLSRIEPATDLPDGTRDVRPP